MTTKIANGQVVEMVGIQQRPQSGHVQKDSFMSDTGANEDPHIGQNQIEEAKVVKGKFSVDMDDESFQTSSQTSSLGNDDVSEETHQFSSEKSISMASSSSDDEAPEIDQPIRVYDARFKIPAQSNIG